MRRKNPAWVFTAAGVAVLGATLSAFPATRLFAERCVAACVAVLRNEAPRAVPEPLRLGAMAPDFTRITASGSRLTLSELRGQVVLVNFWATWCPPCVREMPWFDEFQHTYKDFTVIGVSMDDDGWDAVRPFLEKAGVNYPIVLGDDDLRRDYGDPGALPMTMLLDRSGRIVSMHTGLIDKETYADAILTAMSFTPGSQRR